MYLVFNCGGSSTKIGVSTDGQSIKKFSRFATYQNFDQQLEKIAEVAGEMVGGDRLQAIAGGIAGLWQADRTKLYYSPNLPGWNKIPIRKKIQDRFGVRVKLANDVEMEGLGEANVGAGRRSRIVVYMGIGTGIGGVKIEEGKICSRLFGFEPGYQIIDFGEEIGYLENFAGGAAMKKIYGKEPEDIVDPEIWDKETQLIAMGVHNAIMFWSPEIVILGGSLMKKIKLESLKNKLAMQNNMLPKLPEIVVSELKEKAGLYGALEYLSVDDTGRMGGLGRS